MVAPSMAAPCASSTTPCKPARYCALAAGGNRLKLDTIIARPRRIFEVFIDPPRLRPGTLRGLLRQRGIRTSAPSVSYPCWEGVPYMKGSRVAWGFTLAAGLSLEWQRSRQRPTLVAES